MPSLRELRRKIKSVKSMEQITKAMKMVAAARMRRSQSAILAARPFAAEMEKLVRGLSRERPGEGAVAHPLFERREPGPEMLILVTGDKGLCGSFNTNLIKAALGWLRERPGSKVYVAAAGRKGRDFAHRLRGFDLEVFTELAGIFPKIHFTHAEILGQAVIDAYSKKNISRVTAIYNEFKSVAQQRLVSAQLLPIPPFEGAEPVEVLADYGFEPDRGPLLDALLPRHLKAQLYRILLESQAAELAARMNAMDSASKNAKELREDMNLGMNRQRQAIITKEIAELVGGAEALAA